MSLYNLARPALFSLDAERSHELTLRALARAPWLVSPWCAPVAGEPPVEFAGLRFANRVGLAAGLDKNAVAVAAFERLGFGFIEVGTVTPRAQPGNSRPRMFRLPAHAALINRLGFNNEGVAAAVLRLASAPRRVLVGVNIGKNADTPLEAAAGDYVSCLRQAHAVADYFTLNLSSPNTQGLRDLQARAMLMPLLEAVVGARDAQAQVHAVRRPLMVKIAPDLTETAARDIASAVRESGADGLIVTNTTVERPGLSGETLAKETGGLSGAPLRAQAERVLMWVRSAVGRDFPIIGAGGILTAEAARARIAAGADLVQLYTGLIYRGPGLVGEVRREFRRAGL